MKHYDLASKVLDAAKARGWKIATAESCTGGMISAALTDVAGSSSVFDRGFVTYSYESKTDLLGVRVDTLAEVGAVSQEVASQMARGALNNARADIAVAVTGVAGPGSDGAKPEGMVWLALAVGDDVTTREIQLGAIGRNGVRQATVKVALDMLLGGLAT